MQDPYSVIPLLLFSKSFEFARLESILDLGEIEYQNLYGLGYSF